jgi:hypothetical protein
MPLQMMVPNTGHTTEKNTFDMWPSFTRKMIYRNIKWQTPVEAYDNRTNS